LLRSATFEAVTDHRLRLVGVQPGWRCLEVGAGNGSIARHLAGTVGATGRVEVTDLTLDHLNLPAGDTVVVRRHDITTDALPMPATTSYTPAWS
jgi:ubiquinone/menaquinone biosynthesis C-methylase UbiE